VSDILERIQRVAADLRAVEKELSALSKSDLSLEERLQEELDFLLRHDVTQQLKFAVDSMRELLWTYFEQLSKNRGIAAEDALNSVRLRRITDMLHTLRQSSEAVRAASSPTPETTSFLSEIQHFACQITDVRRAEALTQERAALQNPDKFPEA
jgi:hypothetical protein